MGRLKLAKGMVIGLIALLVVALNSIGVSAEWRQDNNGWWYSQESSYYTGWKQIGDKWYYFGQDGYMKTGWIEENGRWYYLYSNGEKAFNTVIDGCELDKEGCWNMPSKEANEARNLILEEDSNFISKNAKEYGAKLSTRYSEGNINNFIVNDKWNLQVEDVYVFNLVDSSGEYEICGYLVGKESNNIYCVPHQGGLPIYQIKNNEIVKTYKWLGNDAYPYEWRC